MAVDIAQLLSDLRAETAVVEAMLVDLDPADWERPTVAAGWAIRDHVSHLAYFDDAATLAARDPDAFRESARELLALGDDFPDQVADRYRAMPPEELHDWFTSAREAFLREFAAIDPSVKLPWYGPDMSAASSITARLMETWAHGRDIADTLGREPEPTERLRHIAHIGARTLGHSFALRGRPLPAEPVYVALSGPAGDAWTWGPPDATNSIHGPALDFCLVVTQRRNVADTQLQITGPIAAEWMAIAQAYAGAPGPGRPPQGESGRVL